QRTISKTSAVDAPWRRTGFNWVVMLVLSLERHPPCRTRVPEIQKVLTRMVAHDTSSTPDKATDRARQHKPRTPLRRAIALPADTSKVARFVLRRAGEKKLTQVASSLTFTTVLSIVPMLAVVLALFTAFPLFGEFRLALEDFLTTNL